MMDFELDEFQKNAVNSKERNNIVLAGAGSGKAQPINTLIPTKNGNIRMGDLKVGDFVFSELGRETMVTGVFTQGVKDVYQVEFSDGRRTECCEEHLWSYYENNELVTVPLSFLKETGLFDGTGRAIFKIPNNRPIKTYNTLSLAQRKRYVESLLWESNDMFKSTVFKYRKDAENLQEVLFSMGVSAYLKPVVGQSSDHIEYLVLVYEKNTNNSTEITAIKKIGKKECVCISVDNPTQLYLTNSLIVTHNTTVMAERIRILIEEKDVDPNEIVAITYTNLATEQLLEKLEDVDEYERINVSTIHSYANSITPEEERNKLIKLYGSEEELFFEQMICNAVQYTFGRERVYLFVDEFQDVSDVEYRLIRNVPAVERFYVGDDWQAIFEYNGGNTAIFRELMRNKDFKQFTLVNNYRNAQSIAVRGIKIIRDFDEAVPRGVQIKSRFQGTWYNEYTPAMGIGVVRPPYRDWAILCRYREDMDKVAWSLEKRGIPHMLYNRNILRAEKLVSDVGIDAVKILTVHSAKGLEFNNVVYFGESYAKDEPMVDYVATTRARNRLVVVPLTFPSRRGKIVL